MSLFTLLLLFLCQSKTDAVRKHDVDPSKTVIWGPGLQSERITMRARYIFLQLYDSNGEKLSRSPGEQIVSASIEGDSFDGGRCRAWRDILDCKDGSFIIRYKLYNTCFNLRINIRVKDVDLPATPLIFKGPVYEEECYCPDPSIVEWSKIHECPENYSQMLEDLSPFESVDFDAIRSDLIERFHRPHSVSFCNYVSKNNKIFRRCYGRHVGFKMFMDAILLSLARKVMLPDMEFFVNLGDWPLVQNVGTIYPIFSWCGSNDTMDIVMPTYDITESTIQNMGGVTLDILSVQGNTNTPWEEKIEKAFWRGRDSSRERLTVVDLARKYPDLLDASITNFFFFKDEMEKYGPLQNRTSFFNFFEYKYQLNIDGTVAAYRFPYLLAGDSMVFKQDSKYYEFFYKHLVPGKHYVPIKRNLSDLVEKISWAKENDENASKISKAGRQFVRENLLPKDIYCYYAVLFQEWSKRLKNKVEVLADMEEVPQPEHTCNCQKATRLYDIPVSKDEL